MTDQDNSQKTPPEQQDIDGQTPASDLVVLSDVLPDSLSIIPVMNRPIFPGVMTPMSFGGQKIVEALKTAYNNENGYVGIVLVKEQDEQAFERSELYNFGTIAKIYRMQANGNGNAQVILQGMQRFEYVKTKQTKPSLKWQVKYYKDPDEKPGEVLKAYANSIIGSVKELINKNALMQEQLRMILSNIPNDKPGLLMDLISSILSAEPEKLQELLESTDLDQRGEKLLILLREEIELSEIQGKIQKQIDEKVNKQQKEYFLREQLKAIKKELGLEKDDKSQEIEKLKEQAQSLSKEAIISALKGMRNRKEMHTFLKNTTLPVLFIAGKQDVRIPVQDLLQQVALPAHSELLLLEHSAHMGWIEQQEITLPALKHFAKRIYNLK